MEESKSALPKKILIVDDNRHSRERVVKILKTKGYQTVKRKGEK